MSTDGPGIFESDTAHDVRSSFRRLLTEGRSSLEAADEILREWQPDQSLENGTEVWLALAAAQRELGQLLPDVRDRAIAIIDSGADLGRWRHTPASLAERKSVLAALGKKLRAPQPVAKVPKPRQAIPVLSWDSGSVLAYRLPNESLCLLRVVQFAELPDTGSPVVELLDWNGEVVPEASEFDAFGVMKSMRRANEKYMMHSTSLSECKRASKRISVVGWSSNFVRPAAECSVLPICWSQLDQEIVSWFGIGGR